MTVKERVLASRLIEKLEDHGNYAKQIGLSGRIITTGTHKEAIKKASIPSINRKKEND